MIDMCPCVSSCDEWLLEMIRLQLSLRLTLAWVSVQMCLGYVGVQSAGVERRESRWPWTRPRRDVPCRWTWSGERWTWDLNRGTKREGRLAMETDTWWHRQANVHAKELTMLTKSRRWFTKLSGGTDLKFDHFAPGINWFNQNNWGHVRDCVIAI